MSEIDLTSRSSETLPAEERLRRWRLLLGGEDADGTGVQLSGADVQIDRCLGLLYDPDYRSATGRGSNRGGLGASNPSVSRWLGDIRTYFPTSVVQVLQKDALDRLNLTAMLTQPELLQTMEVDVHLIATLLTLRGAMPRATLETARQVVRRVTEDLMRRLEGSVRQSIMGALARSTRNRRPRLREIDWHRTIRANLRNYQPEHSTVIAEQLIGFGRRRTSLKDVVLCVDQSGSMAGSVVYSSIFGAVMASLPAVSTRLVLFDTAIVDLTEQISDPVEVLFSTQLGGGTDINQALAYCQERMERPSDTILVLISDLIEGGVRDEMLRRTAQMVGAGVQMIALLALSDEGAPFYDKENAAALATLGVPAFACTPDLFPELMAAAIRRDDLSTWASAQGVTTAK